MPIVGGAGQKAFSTGLESFDIPWEASGGRASGSIGGSSAQGSSMAQGDYEAPEQDSGGSGMDLQKMSLLMQMQKTKNDFKRMVAQARFFLPRTLEQIGGQYGTQGSYWSSGRRESQQEAAKKTRFDIQQAKADAEFAIKQTWLQLAEMEQAEQGSRSA